MTGLEIDEPGSVAEAVTLLDELGERGRAYAGGTALLLEPRAELRRLVDLKGIDELREVRVEGERLVVGATVTLRGLAGDRLVQRLVPSLAALPGRIANARVLTAATLGGNLRLAHPRTDPPTLLAALDARVRCVSPAGERDAAVEELWAWPAVLAPAELITAVDIPVPDARAAVAAARFNPRGWPTANVAVALRAADGHVEEARVAMAASGGPPSRWPAAELLFAERPLRDIDARPPAVVEIELADDAHGSAEYKHHLLGVLAGRAAHAAAAELLAPREAS